MFVIGFVGQGMLDLIEGHLDVGVVVVWSSFEELRRWVLVACLTRLLVEVRPLVSLLDVLVLRSLNADRVSAFLEVDDTSGQDDLALADDLVLLLLQAVALSSVVMDVLVLQPFVDTDHVGVVHHLVSQLLAIARRLIVQLVLVSLVDEALLLEQFGCDCLEVLHVRTVLVVDVGLLRMLCAVLLE